MNKRACWFVIAAVVAVSVAAALLAAPVAAQEPRTLTGEYIWNQIGKADDLEAVFSPLGEDRWAVSFHFTFRGQAHVYSGVAQGDLAEGELSGEVQNENKRRTFVFRGSFERGKFRGTHAEVADGEEYKTGTLTLG